MGYLYIESKSFELQLGVGNGGFRLAEWSRGLFRSVVMGFQSVVWMLNMEELMNGLTSNENHYGQYLEITEYGKGGRRNYVLIPEGRDSCGWGRCISQLRRLVKHFAPAGIAGQQSRLIQRQLRPVEDRWTFAEVVAGQRVETESESLSKGSLGRSSSRLEKRRYVRSEITLFDYGLRRCSLLKEYSLRKHYMYGASRTGLVCM
jgi:hypothetical protein